MCSSACLVPPWAFLCHRPRNRGGGGAPSGYAVQDRAGEGLLSHAMSRPPPAARFLACPTCSGHCRHRHRHLLHRPPACRSSGSTRDNGFSHPSFSHDDASRSCKPPSRPPGESCFGTPYPQCSFCPSPSSLPSLSPQLDPCGRVNKFRERKMQVSKCMDLDASQ